MQTTPNRGYSFPEYTDPANFPTQIQDFATDVDTDLDTNLRDPALRALNAPSVRAFRGTGTQNIPAGANTTLQYDLLPTYDNDNMYDGTVSLTNITVQTAGVYLITGSVNLAQTGVAGGAAALIVMSSGGVVQNPVGDSRELDNDKPTSISCTTLHNVAVVPETITMFVRHNHANPLTASIAQISVTRI
ncbi:hypothetical protein [Streptomyces sp. NPDC002122]|uniref:hypothetical protein n=1 Tax=Streptomyces sp. NPDC002122 TaxID=3154407 RepID=UPI00332D522C